MNVSTLSPRHYGRLFTAALAFLICSGGAWADTYDPATRELTISAVTVGGASFYNMVVTVAGVVSGPTGTTANGFQDTYDTASGQLTIPWVTVGTSTYYNVVATVGNVISIAGTVSADT